MWRLTATLLLVTSVWTTALDFHLPHNFKIKCRTATTVVSKTISSTLTTVKTIDQIKTEYVTITQTIQKAFPKTLYQTKTKTLVTIQTSVVTVSAVQYVDNVVTQTVPSPPLLEDRYITTTRVVPQVRYITQTQVQTQVVPVEVTRTQIQTINTPVVNYQTQVVQQTQYVSVPGPDVVRTRVQTVVWTSIVRSQQPDNTRYLTATSVRQVAQTSVVRGQDVIRTSVVQRQQVIPYTSVNTRYENAYATREQVVTRTNVVTQTQYQTQVVPQEVLRTQVVQNTIYNTIYRTQVQPFTQVQTVVQTQYVTPAPVYQTLVVTSSSVVQVTGQLRVVTQQVAKTHLVTKTVTLSVNHVPRHC